jgi:hypothetical protein
LGALAPNFQHYTTFRHLSRPNFNRRLAFRLWAVETAIGGGWQKFVGSAGGWLTAGLNAFLEIFPDFLKILKYIPCTSVCLFQTR